MIPVKLDKKHSITFSTCAFSFRAKVVAINFPFKSSCCAIIFCAKMIKCQHFSVCKLPKGNCQKFIYPWQVWQLFPVFPRAILIAFFGTYIFNEDDKCRFAPTITYSRIRVCVLRINVLIFFTFPHFECGRGYNTFDPKNGLGMHRNIFKFTNIF